MTFADDFFDGMSPVYNYAIYFEIGYAERVVFDFAHLSLSPESYTTRDDAALQIS